MAGRRRLCAGAVGLALAMGPVVASTGASAQAALQPVDLTVMTFNIWYGATVTHGLDEVVRAIREADADVVGLQEPYARTRRIAKALGFHASPRMHLVSRFPILEPSGSNGDWAYLLLAPGEVAAIANTHLTCCPYTPYRIVNRGFGRAEAMAQERRTRLDQIRDHLSALQPVAPAGGQRSHRRLNTPSYRDDTRRGSRARASVRDALAGLARDGGPPGSGFVPGGASRSGRGTRVHVDPGYPAPYVYPGRCSTDRLVWNAGPGRDEVEPGDRRARANADRAIRPWPSDHRSVASSFTVTPAPMPVSVVAEGESARLGLPLRARFHAEGPSDHVILAATGSTTALADCRPVPARRDGGVRYHPLEQGRLRTSSAGRDRPELSRDTVV